MKKATHRPPGSGLATLQKRVGLVNALSGEWEARETPLWWHPALGVFSASQDLTTLWRLTSPLGRIWRSMRALRQDPRAWRSPEGPYDIGMRLPSDAVIIGVHRSREPLIASSAEGRVLKWIARGRRGENRLRPEVEALQIGTRVDGGVHVPELYAHGDHEGEVDWMFTEYIPNPRPMSTPHETATWRWLWVPWLRREGLPFMWRFYLAAELEALPTSSLLDVTQLNGLSGERRRGLFYRERDRADGMGDVPVIRALVHGDFSPGHVHRDRSGFTVIDWGNSKRDHAFKDVLGIHWRNPGSTRAGAGAFWAWISKERAPVPPDVRAFLASQEEAIGLAVSPSDFRIQLRLAMLGEMAPRLAAEARGEKVSGWRRRLDSSRMAILSGEMR